MEEQKAALLKDIKALQLQLYGVTEENRRMRVLHRVDIENEVQLRDFLAQHNCPLESFGKDGYRKLSELYAELEQGHCWLELDIDKKPVRILEMLFLKVLYKDLGRRCGRCRLKLRRDTEPKQMDRNSMEFNGNQSYVNLFQSISIHLISRLRRPQPPNLAFRSEIFWAMQLAAPPLSWPTRAVPRPAPQCRRPGFHA